MDEGLTEEAMDEVLGGFRDIVERPDPEPWTPRPSPPLAFKRQQ